MKTFKSILKEQAIVLEAEDYASYEERNLSGYSHAGLDKTKIDVEEWLVIVSFFGLRHKILEATYDSPGGARKVTYHLWADSDKDFIIITEHDPTRKGGVAGYIGISCKAAGNEELVATGIQRVADYVKDVSLGSRDYI